MAFAGVMTGKYFVSRSTGGPGLAGELAVAVAAPGRDQEHSEAAVPRTSQRSQTSVKESRPGQQQGDEGLHRRVVGALIG